LPVEIPFVEKNLSILPMKAAADSLEDNMPPKIQ